MNRFTMVAIAVVLSGIAQAQFNGINSTYLMTRYYNDVPNSQLTADNPWNSVHFHDVLSAQGGGNGWANRHDWALSNDGGASAYMFDGTQNFSVDFDLNLNDSGLPGVEAGFMLDNPGNGNHWFLIKDGNNGEVVAFGGGLPFYSFTANQNVHWTLGEPVHMGMDYIYDGTSGYVQYRYNNLVSGFLKWGNAEGKMLANTRVGGYALFQNDPNSEVDYGDALWSNINIVPEPFSLIAMGLGLAVVIRRRRR